MNFLNVWYNHDGEQHACDENMGHGKIRYTLVVSLIQENENEYKIGRDIMLSNNSKIEMRFTNNEGNKNIFINGKLEKKYMVNKYV